CSSDASSSPRISAAPSGSGIARSSDQPTPTPAPTAPPTPRYTNPPDEELTALIPAEVAGHAVSIPPPTDFAYTPGDFGEAYGQLGLRFTALQVAFVPTPRLSLYAARVDGPPVETSELEPHLETAGRYVGIAGLVREPWELVTIGDRVAWVRPEDDATAAGTMIYTWAAGEYVFLLIGVDDTLNRALFAALPGEAAPTPSPRPSRSPAPSGSATPSSGASDDPG
ncbi:MAG: hypothetical protein ACRDHD_12690, partial [Candidatus Limnocylindria bacterium]